MGRILIGGREATSSLTVLLLFDLFLRFVPVYVFVLYKAMKV